MAKTREAAWALKRKKLRPEVFARKLKDARVSWCSSEKEKKASQILRLCGLKSFSCTVATADLGNNVLEKIDFGGSANRSLAAYGDLFKPENRAILEKSGIVAFAQLELVPVNKDACISFLRSFDGAEAVMGKMLKLNALSVAKAFHLPNSGEGVGAQCLQEDTIEELFGSSAKCAGGYLASELREIKDLARFLNENVEIRENKDVVSKELLSAAWNIFELNEAAFNWAAVLAKRLREECTLAVNGKLTNMSHCAQFLTHFISCELGWGLDMGSSLEQGSKVQPFTSKVSQTLQSEEVEFLGPEQHSERPVIEEAVNEALNVYKKQIETVIEAAKKEAEVAQKEAEAAKEEVIVIKKKTRAFSLECEVAFQRYYEEMRNLKILVAKLEEESQKKDSIIEEVQKRENECRESLRQLEKGVNLHLSQLRHKYKLDKKSSLQ